MSKYANSQNAYVWLDGDAFRGEAGAEMPTDPFAETISNFDAFGGIEAGFEVTVEQSIDKKTIFNKRDVVYKIVRQAVQSGMKFRAVDNTKASLLTRAQGGKVTKKGELYTMTPGLGEEFSFLVTLNDGVDKMGFWCPRVTLAAPVTRAAIDGQNIDGWDFDISFLEPVVEILPKLPAGVSV